MSLIISLFDEIPFLIFPGRWFGWLGLAAWLAALVAVLLRWRQYQKTWHSSRGIIFAALVLATLIAGVMLGLRLPAWNALPLPGVTLEPDGLAVMKDYLME